MTKTARDMRRCALQTLYQFDAAGYDPETQPAEEAQRTAEIVRGSLERADGGEHAHAAGFELAQAAWTLRAEADAAVALLAPDWPTHRQPVIDRNILRLAYYEIVTGETPPKVAINEAVELAREFSTEKSPLFVNGVLDKIYKARRPAEPLDDDATPADETMPAANDH